MSAKKSPQRISQGSMLIEILHIDTHKSRDLYRTAQLNQQEKAKAQGLLKEQFYNSCAKYDGKIHTWNGDGGFAFFKSNVKFGQSVKAAEDFLQSLQNLNAQTALAFDVPELTRNVRIAAHRGEIFLTGDASIDSADPEHFDDFIKGEKKIAAENDELFITSQLYSILSAKIKRKFLHYKKIKMGSLATDVHRKKTTPVLTTHDIFKLGDQLSQITQSEWIYLKSQIIQHQLNVAARNEITKGLIKILDQKKSTARHISSEDILELTLDSLYAYLQAAFPKNDFRVTYWQLAVGNDRNEYLEIVAYRYPEGEMPSVPSRRLATSELKYRVCRALQREETIVTRCVVHARNKRPKLWYDFHNGQASKKRHLASAMQIPVYYCNSDKRKIMQGVLCLDSDRPDTFLVEEIPLWTDALVGYLVNIALSEILFQRKQ